MKPRFERQYDLLDPETHRDPWPMYTWLREEAPLYWDDINEIWAISRYDDILKVSRKPEVFCSTEGNRPNLPPDSSLIHQDGVEHAQRRRLVGREFAPSAIKTMEEHVRTLVTELLDEAIPQGRCDFVAAVAAPLPLRLIGGMLGLPREDLPRVQGWVDQFVKGGNGPESVTDAVEEAFGQFAEYHEDLVEKRRGCPAHDLLGIWLQAKIDGEPLSEDILLFEHTLLLVGGSETTRNVMSHGIEAFSKFPESWEKLKARPELMDNAIEEIIRWATPFVSMSRTATRDVEMHGITIEEGEQVKMLYPPANRDPRKFEDPDRFDIERDFSTPHIAFGHGPHICLGNSLARLELRVVFEELIARAPNLRIPDGECASHVPSSFLRGIDRLPVVFHPDPA